MEEPTVYTIGHSNQPLQRLVDMLRAAGVERLVDIRRYPMSRRNPQFNRDALDRALCDLGIEYLHFEDLGGRRNPASDSINTALRNDAFRGYADYSRTPQFEAAFERLIRLGAQSPTAVMCAEVLPWRCHRFILSDVLTARGVRVRHLLGEASQAHTLSPIARIDSGRLSYPALL